MSLIDVSHLTFSYDGRHENIFHDVSIQLDTSWKIGFCGRNGRGKTTFLKLLMKEYEYIGNIVSTVNFDYYPYTIHNTNTSTINIIKLMIPTIQLWEIEYELNQLSINHDCLYRKFNTLSNGEQNKILLIILFLKDNNFPLIDEPTNHLDVYGRKIVSEYLQKKKGFIVVSHDRTFLDACVNHILSINKSNIEIVNGNFTSWYNNKELQDKYEIEKNEHIKREIKRLKETAREKATWSDRVEATKIGTHQADRGRIGHLAAKMMKRAKSIEKRSEAKIIEKSKLLKNIERSDPLKLSPLLYHSKKIASFNDVSISYNGKSINNNISFIIEQGDRISIEGINGSGKSSFIKLIMGEKIDYFGNIVIPDKLSISYIPQDTSFLSGFLDDFTESECIDKTLFKTILKKLDFSREQFDNDMSIYSVGQKKKVLIASSLCKKANIYVWDEPLNYVDVLSRIQLEELIMKYLPTLVFVEHDSVFNNRIATKHVKLNRVN